MVRVKLVFWVTLFVICKWRVVCETEQEQEQEHDWSQYQKLHTIQIGLIQNKHLDEFLDSSTYSINDNQVFTTDRTKVKRSYDTEQCIRDLIQIQKAFRDKNSNWATEMLATWGKLSPVGIDKNYGNFDRCHDLEMNKSINIETQYCLGRIDASRSEVRKIISERSTVGICIPNSCAPSLIANILDDYLVSNKSIQIYIGAHDCRFKNDNTTIFLSYQIFMAFLTMVFGLIILSSTYDIIFTIRKVKNPLLLAFSAYSNGRNLFACKSDQSPSIMSCLDGIRAIAALWIVAVHFNSFSSKVMANRNNHVTVGDRLEKFFLAGRFGVDTFFVLSAMLAANKMFQVLSTNGRLNIPLLYLQRVLRLSPVLTVIALFNRYLLQFCANGPEYNNIMDGLRRTCEYSPWDTLLYYSNYYLIECVHGSWYLATDMQLYLITPFMVMLMQRCPKRFMGFSFAIILIDFFILALNSERFGLENYYSVRARISTWLIGVIFAYILFEMRSRKHIRIPKYLNIFLLTLSAGVLTMLLYTSAVVDRSADFLWKGRVWWSLSLCYIIFACLNDQGGIINWFLSQPSWQPISRLSFNIFLIHQTVMSVMFADRKVVWYFSVFTQVQELFLVLAISCAVAVILALTIEMPITNLSHIYLTKKKK
ncbi:nose resistant to fluoxetine protein 6-like isoform X2 [Sitodiplosis mosellana]|uniref:nose resistant to fluoxetine protein 6-like isoform X2 n=1 Tax=Sitodiplosis mosellana TaxID=263140 RepID=UPI002444575A|nr:nose resistant to fluoxetine protein 6-like isoform X2 [Sitodiplosis mosellana]